MNPAPMLFLFLFSLFPACRSSFVRADDSRVVYETEMDASVEDVWQAFTTNEGLRKWMAPLVEIEL